MEDRQVFRSAVVVADRSGRGLAETEVDVDITHSYIGDLRVDLVAPDGSVYKLHNRSGGSSNDIDKTYTVDLSGESLNGTWNLRVKDSGRGDTRPRNSWSVTFLPHRSRPRARNGPGPTHRRTGAAATRPGHRRQTSPR